MATLSICMIIRNEKENLRGCLASVRGIADEIIVVDTGSTDSSPQLALEFGARIFFYEWRNDFSAARNYGLDKASGEWILVLDGDEELDGKDLELIKAKIGTPGIEACLLTVTPSLTNQHELLVLSSLQPRLFKNNKNYRYRGFIHEQILDSILDQNQSADIETASNIKIIHHGNTREDLTGQNRLGQNIKLINRVLEQAGKEHQKYFYLGRECFRHQKYEKALEFFLQAYAVDDHQAVFIPELLRSIVAIYYIQGKTSEALAFANEALGMRAGAADLYYQKGIILKDLGLYSQAYQSIKEALSLLPPQPYHSVFFYHIKYTCLYLLGGLSEYFMDLDGALLYYYESLKNNPYFIDSLRRMVAILHPRKNPEYTVDSLNRIFDLSDPRLQVEIAFIFYQEGAYQPALDCITQLESCGQISENTRLLKGLSLLRVKKYSEAEGVFQNITQDKTLSNKARRYLLLYYWLDEDYRKALECLRQIKIDVDDLSIIYVLNLLTRSQADKTCLDQEQVFSLAKELISLIVELGDSNQVDAAFSSLTPVLGERPSYWLAELFYKYEHYGLARGELLSLLEKDNDYPQVFYYLGKTCWMLGELEAALKNLQHAIVNGLDTPRIRWEKARLYQELAIKTLKEGIHLFPDEFGRNEIQKLEENLLEVPGRETP